MTWNVLEAIFKDYFVIICHNYNIFEDCIVVILIVNNLRSTYPGIFNDLEINYGYCPSSFLLYHSE